MGGLLETRFQGRCGRTWPTYVAEQFAIIGIVSLAFGLVTPPYGLCLMISCAVARVRLRYALKDTMIMLVPMLLVLAAIIAWPEIPLLLPRLISPEFLR
jgi:TRAP-type C4-dicarboxylate transport system permease large subunit